MTEINPSELDYHQAMNSIKEINDEHLLIGLQIEIEAKLLGIRNRKKVLPPIPGGVYDPTEELVKREPKS